MTSEVAPGGVSTKGFLAGGGQMAELIGAFDWAATPLGPLSNWPPSMKTTLALILRSPAAIVTLWGEAGVMIYNDAYSRFAGARHPGLLGSSVREGWEEVSQFNDHVMRTVMAGGTLSYRDLELTLYRNGAPEPVWMNLDYSPVMDEQWCPSGVICVVVETSGKVKAERRLLGEHERLSRMFANAPGFMAMLQGPEHRIVLANPAFDRFVGHRTVGETVMEALPEAAAQGYVSTLDQVYRGGEAFSATGLRYIARAHPGAPPEPRFIDFGLQPVTNMAGEVSGIFVSGIDVTERQVAADLLRMAQEGGGVGAFEWFPDTDRISVSDTYRKIWGLPADVEVTNQRLLDQILPEDRHETGVSRLNSLGNPLEYSEYRIRRADTGEVRWLARRGEVLGPVAGADRRYVGVAWDVTERKLTEEALRNASAELRRLNESLEARVTEAVAERQLWADMFEGAEDPVAAVDRDLRYLAMNRAYRDACERLFGVSLKVGDHITRGLEDKAEARNMAIAVWSRALAGRSFEIAESGEEDPNGSYYDLTFRPLFGRDGVQIGAFQHSRDVTRRVRAQTKLRETESALRQAQKMEAVGQLTGGIAHDFNNMLAVIIGSLDLLERRVGLEDPRARAFFEAARDGARRAALLTQRLLAFSRQQPLKPEPVEVNRLVAGMSALLRHSIGEQVRMETVLAGGLWRAHIDPNQLENVVLNLAVNARDAMPEGGRLTIETQNADLDDRYALENHGAQPGQYVMIAVSDTGSGMPPEVMDKAFDPFFTTKGVGKGTGLGLSQVYGFVKQSGGHVKIYSEVGLGTSVKIYLPRLTEGSVTAAPTPAGPPMVLGDRLEVILVVEDEPNVRQFSAAALIELGYGVLEADGAAAALRLLDQHPEIALLFTDIVMPDVNGRRLADEARERRPGLKVLFTTGYSRNAIVHNGMLDPGVELISKPFTLSALAAQVRRIIDRR